MVAGRILRVVRDALLQSFERVVGPAQGQQRFAQVHQRQWPAAAEFVFQIVLECHDGAAEIVPRHVALGSFPEFVRIVSRGEFTLRQLREDLGRLARLLAT